MPPRPLAALPDPDPEAEPDVILDAARATVLDFGIRRTTVTEVARRAELSRMTVYRRYKDHSELIRALMTREFGAGLTRALREAAELPTGRERTVAVAVRTVELLFAAPLLQRLLELEPELLLPYMTGELGTFQEVARASARAAIEVGQADGSIRPGSPELLAATIETAARSIVFAARAYSTREGAAALDELGRMIDAYLRP